MLKKTGLNCVLVAMMYLTCGFASAADAGEAQPAASGPEVKPSPEKQAEKLPTPKEETANPQSTSQGDTAKPKDDPNCE